MGTEERVVARFADGRVLKGYVKEGEGELPWAKGAVPACMQSKAKGFFLVPVDGDCNNIKVFVVGSAIKDITVM